MNYDRRITSIAYDPPLRPSLYELWESGTHAPIAPPLSVTDPEYRSAAVAALAPYRTLFTRMLSVGAGNGFTEQALQRDGWDVLATDCVAAAGDFCRGKGLPFRQLCLGTDEPADLGRFGVVYCDGVIGHLWHEQSGTARAWRALRRLATSDGILLTSNDLSEGNQAEFKVRGHPDAGFYRPPAGELAASAALEGWQVESTAHYQYDRGGPRLRELLLLRASAHRDRETAFAQWNRHCSTT